MSKIREMVEEDLEDVIECLSELSDCPFASKNSDSPVHKAFVERSRDGNCFTFVYEIIRDYTYENQVVGTATLLLERKLSHGGKLAATIQDVSINSSYQSKGIGKELVQHCIQYARALGCYKVTLNCTPDKVAFYGKCGLEESGSIEMRISI